MSFGKPHVNKTVDKSRQTRERTAEKVREIKLRQQNWFRERDQQIKEKPPTPSSNHLSTTKSGSSTLPSVPHPSNTPSHPSHTPSHPSHTPSHPNVEHSGASNPFYGWLNAREKTNSRERDDASDISGKTFVYDNSGAKRRDRHEQQAAPAVVRESSPTFEELHREAMAPRDDVALANDVINRVKRDMISSHSKSVFSSGSNVPGGFGDGVAPKEALVEKERGRSGGLSSHHCCVCSSLMLETEHAPMLMIPCGHNVCRSCSEVLPNCGACDSAVNSKTVNIMLQQIIQDYRSGRHGEEAMEKENRSQQSYSPKKYSSGPKQQQQTQQQQARYHAELQTLSTRLEVLQEERQSLQSKAATLISAMTSDQLAVDRLTRQETRIAQEIRELQEKLEVVRQDRASVQRKVEERKTEQREAEEKLELVSSTIRSLSQQVEKVKLLAEGTY